MAALPPSVIHRLGQLQRTPSALRFELASRQPMRHQRAALARILGANATTEYGRRFGFADIRTLAEYARRVPLVDYAALRPSIEREQRGERGVLMAEKPVFYARTSGSAGAPKEVPITPSYRREFQESVFIATWHLYRRFTPAFRGRVLYFVGSAEDARTPDGTPIGAISGFNYGAMPALIRSLYAWPAALFGVRDLDARSFLALQLAALGEVSLCAAIFPSTLVYLFRYLETHAEELAAHLERGTLPDRLALSEVERRAFTAAVVPEPGAARRLRAALAGGAALVPALMPRLRLVMCWTAATAAAFVPELEAQLGPEVAVRDAVYAASEGWCSAPLGEPEPGGPLVVTSHYYEWIEAKAFEAGGRDTLTSDALRAGGTYYIVLTSSGGLYRYLLGDVIEVTGHYRRTPVIRFARKGGASSNVTGEKLVEDHVTAAVSDALGALGLRATWFAAAPAPSRVPRPRYALLLELAARAAPPEDLAAHIDAALARACHTYGSRLGSELDPLELRLIPAGTYAAWRQRQVDAGAAESQLKATHLVPELSRLPSAMREAARL